MTLTEVLDLVDRLVKKQRGKHLNDLEKKVIQGLWEHKTYHQIASQYGYDENYIGDVSRRLFRQLSEELSQDIKKSNFCWTIERANYSQFFGSVSGTVNFYSSYPTSSPNIVNKSNNQSLETNDLTLAPKLTRFYDRTTELETLSDWIFTENTRLISVVGLSGIGKTALVKRFIDLNIQRFDSIIWKSIKITPDFNAILKDVIKREKPTQNINVLDCLKSFKQRKFLLVLDDVQGLFLPQYFAGQYQEKFAEYQDFFQRIAQIEHQSHLILISQEQCQEMQGSPEKLDSVKLLQLQGLTTTNILSHTRLKDKPSWHQLLELYEGNPANLQSIASLIDSLFLGKVSDFITEAGRVLTVDIEFKIRETFKRLSPIETEIMIEIGKSTLPLSRSDLIQKIDVSFIDIINGLNSLMRRSLIRRITQSSETVYFDCSDLIRDYIKSL
jgi:GTPase SAR1 family protein